MRSLPSGTLEYHGKMTDEARANLRNEWNLVHQGSAAGNLVQRPSFIIPALVWIGIVLLLGFIASLCW